MSSFTTLLILCMLTFLILPTNTEASFVKVGIEVPPSRHESTDLLTDIDRIHQELYALDIKDSKNSKRIQELDEKVQNAIADYSSSNSCLRYQLREYMSYAQFLDDSKANVNNGMLVSINVKFSDTEQYIDPDAQIININILDKAGDTLRRIGHIREDQVRLLIDYPMISTGEKHYNKQYFDLCFENFKYDKSWNSHVLPILAHVELSFGVDTIKSKYEKSSSNIEKLTKKLERVSNEIEIVAEQLIKHLDTSEPLLRDMNEDTLSKYVILFAIIFVIYVGINFTQIYWLIRYLKNRNLF